MNQLERLTKSLVTPKKRHKKEVQGLITMLLVLLYFLQTRQENLERLRNHSVYYCDEDNINSYDDIIIKLLDFYEERYDRNDYDDNYLKIK